MSRLFSGLAGTVAKGGLVLGGAAFLANSCLYNVEPGHRAIIFDRFKGITNDVKGEGTHFLIPVIQYPIFMDVRMRPKTISTVTGTKDLQKVNLSLRVISRPFEQSLSDTYKRLGYDWEERVLPSVGNEVLKTVVAQFNADQLLIERDQVSRLIREELKERCKFFNIGVEDVSITHLDFSKDFSKAIEDKQVAEQFAERAKFMVAKAEQEQLAMVIRAEGDAEAAQLVSDALSRSGKGLIELRRIETAQQVAETLAGSRNVSYLPSTAAGSGGGTNSGGTNLLLALPVNKSS